MPVKATVEIKSLDLKPGDSIEINWSYLDRKANNGEGGYDFHKILMVRQNAHDKPRIYLYKQKPIITPSRG